MNTIAGVNPAYLNIRYLHSTLHPLSTSFRMLRVPHSVENSIEGVASVAAHIAVLCPRFAFVDIPLEYRKPFGRDIAWAMVHKPFEQFSSAIRHLIFED
ncbi:hypothetical protein GGI01_002178 [Coemansia sp. RSA 376]|nr:hypothetical protein GGI01_002178 [Coemansia sp. RSA 376]